MRKWSLAQDVQGRVIGSWSPENVQNGCIHVGVKKKKKKAHRKYYSLSKEVFFFFFNMSWSSHWAAVGRPCLIHAGHPLYLTPLWFADSRCTSSLRDAGGPLQHLRHHFIRIVEKILLKNPVFIKKKKCFFISLVWSLLHKKSKKKLLEWRRGGLRRWGFNVYSISPRPRLWSATCNVHLSRQDWRMCSCHGETFSPF